MIADNIKNLKKYVSVIPFINEISEFINSNDICSLKPGKYSIAGESAFILVQEYKTKSESEKIWESHRKYLDIQVVLKGEEFMAYADINSMQTETPYNEAQDVTLYKNGTFPHSKIMVTENHFAIFNPEEAHKPGIHQDNEKEIKKAVIKVLIP